MTSYSCTGIKCKIDPETRDAPLDVFPKFHIEFTFNPNAELKNTKIICTAVFFQSFDDKDREIIKAEIPVDATRGDSYTGRATLTAQWKKELIKPDQNPLLPFYLRVEVKTFDPRDLMHTTMDSFPFSVDVYEQGKSKRQRIIGSATDTIKRQRQEQADALGLQMKISAAIEEQEEEEVEYSDTAEKKAGYTSSSDDDERDGASSSSSSSSGGGMSIGSAYEEEEEAENPLARDPLDDEVVSDAEDLLNLLEGGLEVEEVDTMTEEEKALLEAHRVYLISIQNTLWRDVNPLS